MKTDLGSKFDGAGKLAKDEIDMVQNKLTQIIKIYRFLATIKTTRIVSQVVEKFDDLRKFVDTDGVKQHMQATRSLSTSTHPSLIVYLLMFFLKIGCHSFQ